MWKEKLASFLVKSWRLEVIHIKSDQDDQCLRQNVNSDHSTHELFNPDDL